MTRQIAMFLHVLAVMTQGVNAISALLKLGIFPPAWSVWIAVGVGAFQSGVGWIQHNFNADGTPATVAYIPK